MSENEDSPTKYGIKATRRFWISILIIAPSFVLITVMIFFVTYLTTPKNEEILEKLLLGLLPLLAAWVGAVVAFYFGSENLAQAQQTLEKSLSAKQELSSKTIDDILLPDAKQIRKVKMDTKIGEVRKELQDISNVLVLGDNDNPLGVLYRWDLAQWAHVNIYDDPKDPKDDKKNLSQVIEMITEEFITKKPWSEKEGVVNYALLSLSDNLLQAKQKMEEIAKSDQSLLSVRGFVIDKNAKIIAVINFANLTKGIV